MNLLTNFIGITKSIKIKMLRQEIAKICQISILDPNLVFSSQILDWFFGFLQYIMKYLEIKLC